MYPSLETKLKRYDQIEQQLQDPEVSADPNKFLPLQREQGGWWVARAMRRYHALKDDVAAARTMLDEERDPQIPRIRQCGPNHSKAS